jgi:glucose-1-phosphate thymidylyltransferase
VLLGKKGSAAAIAGSVIHQPVSVAANATVENCILGPFVSVAAGAKLKNAVIKDSIINENASVEDILIEGSVIGENAQVRGAFKRLNVGDSSEVRIT